MDSHPTDLHTKNEVKTSVWFMPVALGLIVLMWFVGCTILGVKPQYQKILLTQRPELICIPAFAVLASIISPFLPQSGRMAVWGIVVVSVLGGAAAAGYLEPIAHLRLVFRD